MHQRLIEHLPVSMSDARRLGLPMYYTGRPCKSGHVAPRYVRSGSCSECHRVATAKHRADGRHRVAFAVWYRRKRAANPEYFLHQAAKRRAKLYGIPFDITPDDVRRVWPSDNRCPITLQPFDEIRNGRGRKPNRPSVDRIDPARGYAADNIAVISMRANLIKRDVTDPAVFRRLADWLEARIGGEKPYRADPGRDGSSHCREAPTCHGHTVTRRAVPHAYAGLRHRATARDKSRAAAIWRRA
jgi:hypothetical protein